MKVLHYIPTLTKRMKLAATLAQRLHVALGMTMETHLFTGDVSRREFLQKLYEVNPDVVHIHGCWDRKIYDVEQWVTKRGYPVVLSLYGGMEDKVLRDRFWKKRLPRIIAYQFRTIRKATALHTFTENERDSMKQLGWKSRIAMIPIPEKEEDYQTACDAFHTLYQKVIDTTSRNMLHNNERRWLWTLIQVAVTQQNATLYSDEADYDLKKLAAKASAELTSYNWRTLQIFAYDHGLTERLREGQKKANIIIPNLLQNVPPRFAHKELVKKRPDKKAERIMKEDEKAVKETTVAADIYRLKAILSRNRYDEGWQTPYCLLIEIYGILRWSDCDEGKICALLEKYSLTPFAGRIMEIIAELLDLPLGYMPLDPVDDKQTEHLKRRLDTAVW